MTEQNNNENFAYSAVSTTDIARMAVAAQDLSKQFDKVNENIQSSARSMQSLLDKVDSAATSEERVARKAAQERREAAETELRTAEAELKLAELRSKKATAEEREKQSKIKTAELERKAIENEKKRLAKEKTDTSSFYTDLHGTVIMPNNYFQLAHRQYASLAEGREMTGLLPVLLAEFEQKAKKNDEQKQRLDYEKEAVALRKDVLKEERETRKAILKAEKEQAKEEEKREREKEKRIKERHKRAQALKDLADKKSEEQLKKEAQLKKEEEDKRQARLRDMLDRSDSLSEEELNSLSDDDKQELLSMAYAKNARSRESALQYENSTRRGITKAQALSNLKGAYKQSMTSGSLGPLKSFFTSTLLTKAGPWAMLIAVLVKFIQIIKKVGEQFKQTFDKSQKSLSALGQTSVNLNKTLGRSQHDLASANAKLNTFKVGAATAWNTFVGLLLKAVDALAEFIPAIKETEKVYAGINRRAAMAGGQTELIGRGMNYGNSFTTASNIDAAATAYLMKAYGISASEARNHGDYQQVYNDMTSLVTSGGQSGMFNTSNWQAYGYTNGLYIPGVQYTDSYLDTLRSQMLADELSIYQESGAEGLADWNNNMSKIQTLVGNIANSVYSFDHVEQINAVHLDDLDATVQDLGTLEDENSKDEQKNVDWNIIDVNEHIDNNGDAITEKGTELVTAIENAAARVDEKTGELVYATETVGETVDERAGEVVDTLGGVIEAINGIDVSPDVNVTVQPAPVYVNNGSTQGSTQGASVHFGSESASDQAAAREVAGLRRGSASSVAGTRVGSSSASDQAAAREVGRVSDGSTLGAKSLDYSAAWKAYDDLAAYINRTAVYSDDYYRKDYLGQLKTGIQGLTSQSQIDSVAKQLVEEKKRLSDFAKNGTAEALAEGFNGQNFPVWMQALLGTGATVFGSLGLTGAAGALAGTGAIGSAIAGAAGAGSGVWSIGKLIKDAMETLGSSGAAFGGSYATGGIGTSKVTNATLFENGPEAVIPLTSELGKNFMAESLARAADMNGSGMTETQYINNIHFDGPVFAQDNRQAREWAEWMGDYYNQQVIPRRGGKA